ncbi:hypothetical protein BpHYR1_037549 [Brachionus plicatilis]|uniref:Uncharacterized protein n=1 Tax=Brachionus plicatilis TaxID=10195 RepID=A0A3M7RZG5_BRAPC|nr:hypothetical protein BpHYR1_037549 [Brachionus plicatilis]
MLYLRLTEAELYMRVTRRKYEISNGNIFFNVCIYPNIDITILHIGISRYCLKAQKTYLMLIVIKCHNLVKIRQGLSILARLVEILVKLGKT